MDCSIGKSKKGKILVGIIIVVLFMFAYKLYNNKKRFFEKNEDDDEKPSILNKIRGKSNEKKEDGANTVDKAKIDKIVTDILTRQIPG